MPIDSSSRPKVVRPGDVAFVVHLSVTAAPGETGRVEHLTTGRASKFESAAELLRFMQETLAGLGAERP